MGAKATSLFLAALIICLISFSSTDHHVSGSSKSATYSMQDPELERQLRLFNKPSTVTIQTTNGDSYNCVNFYEQPAFDHPLLKDHKFDFRPSSWYSSVDSAGSSNDIWVNGKGCPIGTVPIRKVSRDYLLRAKLLAAQHRRKSNNLQYPHLIDENPYVRVAVLRTTQDKKYYGGGMITSIYNFEVNSKQYSSSRIKVQNGFDSISAGWTINPGLYGDTSTRYFIYTTTKDTQCYNTFCPGFIIMTPDIPLDSVLQPSVRGNDTMAQKFFIRKDAANGDWFLQIGLDNSTVGSWPQRIFSTLNDSGTYVDWGGEAYAPFGEDLPAMGSGFPPIERARYDCYGRQVTLIDENHEVDYNPPGCGVHSSNLERYNVFDEGNQGGDAQRLILFGGTSGPNS